MRYKDSEQSSSSQFNQAVPALPVVDFDKYLADDENITDTVRPCCCHYMNAAVHQLWGSTGRVEGWCALLFILLPFMDKGQSSGKMLVCNTLLADSGLTQALTMLTRQPTADTHASAFQRL